MFWLQIYFLTNCIVMVSAFFAMSLGFLLKTINKNISSAQVLMLQYTMLFATFSSFVLLYFLPEENIESPMPQQFSSAVINLKTSINSSLIESSTAAQIYNSSDYVNLIAIALGLMVLFKLFKLAVDIYKTRRSFQTGFLYKKCGKLSIYISDQYLVPYAFSFLGKSFVSVPMSLIKETKNLKISLLHEIQHIRSKDTWFSFFGELLKAVFFINPILIKWIDYIGLEQEFSCDESVTARKNILIKDYKSCLLEVAQIGRSESMCLVGATRFIFNNSRSELSRRIYKMSKENKKIGKVLIAGIITASLSVVCASAYTLKVHAAIGGLSIAEVKSLVKSKDFSKDFPVEVNEKVVKWVNKYARTQKGIKYTRQALSNYYGYKDNIQKHIKDYGHPVELAAIPFVESKYQNRPQPKNKKHGAGLWMFISPTARIYNLKVSDHLDERLDVIKETDAAMRYLGALNLRFQDWRLAMLSYNAGESAVQKVIDKTGSRDVWKITQSGLRYDKDYMAKVMAAAIIMKYPEIVR